jgi:hypothetical protein
MGPGSPAGEHVRLLPKLYLASALEQTGGLSGTRHHLNLSRQSKMPIGGLDKRFYNRGIGSLAEKEVIQ